MDALRQASNWDLVLHGGCDSDSEQFVVRWVCGSHVMKLCAEPVRDSGERRGEIAPGFETVCVCVGMHVCIYACSGFLCALRINCSRIRDCVCIMYVCMHVCIYACSGFRCALRRNCSRIRDCVCVSMYVYVCMHTCLFEIPVED